MQEHKRLRWLQVLAALALLVSLLLTYDFYQETPVPGFCFLEDTLNCNIINRSPYATLDGIFHFFKMDLALAIPFDLALPVPNALLASFVFLFLFLGATRLSHKQPFLGMQREALLRAMKVLLYLSFGYAIYLAYVAGFILWDFCLLCILLDVLLIALLWLVIGLDKAPSAGQKRKKR